MCDSLHKRHPRHARLAKAKPVPKQFTSPYASLTWAPVPPPPHLPPPLPVHFPPPHLSTSSFFYSSSSLSFPWFSRFPWHPCASYQPCSSMRLLLPLWASQPWQSITPAMQASKRSQKRHMSYHVKPACILSLPG